MTGRRGVPATDPYSPERRTALLLTGTGTAGAYHAGVLRALHEAGVKVDLVAGCGIGAVGALFAAIDGAQRLWDDTGFWRLRGRPLYPWRPVLRGAVGALAVALVIVAVPLLVVALGLVVFPIDFVLKMAGLGGAGGLTSAYMGGVERAFAPEGLPTWLPRLVVLVLGAAGVVALLAGSVRTLGRSVRGQFWWRFVPSPLSSEPAVERCWGVLWELIRGATQLKTPGRRDLVRRYAEMLTDNLGQPGFRELLIVTHDIDAGRDLVFALVSETRRRTLIRRASAEETEARRAEVVDLAAADRDHLADAVAGALTVPIATEFHPIHFAADSYWRGETHRVSDRPGALARAVDELAGLDVGQIILVSAAPTATGPHALASPRLDGRARLGEYLASSEAAAVRDVLTLEALGGPAMFTIRPTHNPVGPFDFSGGFDDRSSRRQDLSELMRRGYEDAYHQFIEPIVGASGERIGQAGEGPP